MTRGNNRATVLLTFFLLAWPVEAQIRGMPEMPAPTMPTPTPVPNIPPMPGPVPGLIVPPTAPPVAPENEVIAPERPSLAAPGCPGGPGCPPDIEGEGPFTEAVKEMLKEFAKCEAEGKSLDQCLSDDPPQPHLSQLTQEYRVQLAQCLGSSDLLATKARWAGCLVGAD